MCVKCLQKLLHAGEVIRDIEGGPTQDLSVPIGQTDLVASLGNIDSCVVQRMHHLSRMLQPRGNPQIFTGILACIYETESQPANSNPARKAEAPVSLTGLDPKQNDGALNCTVPLSYVAHRTCGKPDQGHVSLADCNIQVRNREYYVLVDVNAF